MFFNDRTLQNYEKYKSDKLAYNNIIHCFRHYKLT